MKKLIGIIVVVAVIAGLVLVRLKRARDRDQAPLVKEVPVAVQVASVSTGKVVRIRHVLGTTLGAEEMAVAARVMAQVLEVKVREGARVRQGDLLVVLDDREFQDAVAEAEASLASAQAAYHAQHNATAREKRLFEVKAISREQWDRSQAARAAKEAQLKVAEKRLNQARTRLSYCRLTAPADGVVSQRLVDPGDLAAPGKPLLKVVRQQNVRVRAELPAADLPRLRVGQTVALSLHGQTFEAPIARVFPALSPSRLAAFEVEVTDPPPGLVSGATVGVDVHLSAAEGLTVPVDALLEGEKGACVFVVRDGTVHPTPVQIPDRSLERAVVKGDLRAGDHVIVARPSRLMTFAEGAKVFVPQPQ